MFCPQCGKAMAGQRCEHCGAFLSLHALLMHQRASGLDWTLRVVQILLALCGLAVALMALMTIFAG